MKANHRGIVFLTGILGVAVAILMLQIPGRASSNIYSEPIAMPEIPKSDFLFAP